MAYTALGRCASSCLYARRNMHVPYMHAEIISSWQDKTILSMYTLQVIFEHCTLNYIWSQIIYRSK